MSKNFYNENCEKMHDMADYLIYFDAASTLFRYCIAIFPSFYIFFTNSTTNQ